MKIQTKYDVGQRVYSKATGEEMTVEKVVIKLFEEECDVIYVCPECESRFRRFKENELTEERPKPKSIYDLKDGDTYFLLSNLGCVRPYTFDGGPFDEKAIAQGNVFLTAEEAEKEAKRRHVHQELKQAANEYEFTRGRQNYTICRGPFNDNLQIIAARSYYQPGAVYFATEEEAQEAIRVIGSKRLKKDYFGVEQNQND